MLGRDCWSCHHVFAVRILPRFAALIRFVTCFVSRRGRKLDALNSEAPETQPQTSPSGFPCANDILVRIRFRVSHQNGRLLSDWIGAVEARGSCFLSNCSYSRYFVMTRRSHGPSTWPANPTITCFPLRKNLDSFKVLLMSCSRVLKIFGDQGLSSTLTRSR